MANIVTNPIIPQAMFLTKGVGKHREKLNSFEYALRNAGIAKFNLVQVSSILPPNCKFVSKKKGRSCLHPGQILFTVMSRNASNEPGRMIAAAIGCAIPADKNNYGYISEHHSFGQREKVAGEYSEDIAAEMLASTLGIPFDIDASYDEKRELFQIDNRIVRTRHVAQSARCDKNGLWTTVIAAAIFIC